MKKLLFLALMLFSVVVGMAQGKKNITISSQSQLVISGDTNIRDFLCHYNSYRLQKSHVLEIAESSEEITFNKAVLVLRNEGFNCGNKQINKDFHALLKTEEYPEISLELKRLGHITSTGATADVIITIAGVQKAFQLKVQNSADNCITGNLTLDIRDFGLEPPRKAFGLIKVKEDIVINFNLYLEVSG